MNIPSNFSFYGVRRTLPAGLYSGKIIDFSFQEKTSKAGKPYVTLSAKAEIEGQTYFVNLSLDPQEVGKSTNNLIKQLAQQLSKSELELVELCSNPVDFFNIALNKTVMFEATEKGYIDVMGKQDAPVALTGTSNQVIDPNDIPF